jgi:hypothetical protein
LPPPPWAVSLALTSLAIFSRRGKENICNEKIEDSDREKIAEEVLTTFKIECDPWGITVERVEV